MGLRLGRQGRGGEVRCIHPPTRPGALGSVGRSKQGEGDSKTAPPELHCANCARVIHRFSCRQTAQRSYMRDAAYVGST